MTDHPNYFATVAEVLLLTEGYLNDGYGEADLRERLSRARPALEALAALGREAAAERQQAKDALREAKIQSLHNIRRAAFAPEIGSRYTEKLRLAIADECRRLEDDIDAALAKLGAAGGAVTG